MKKKFWAICMNQTELKRKELFPREVDVMCLRDWQEILEKNCMSKDSYPDAEIKFFDCERAAVMFFDTYKDWEITLLPGEDRRTITWMEMYEPCEIELDEDNTQDELLAQIADQYEFGGFTKRFPKISEVSYVECYSDQDTFGKEYPILAIRHDLKLSRAEFSRLLNIPVRTLEDWDCGEHYPPKYVIDLIKFRLQHMN